MDPRVTYNRLHEELAWSVVRERVLRAAEHHKYVELQDAARRCVELAGHYEALATRQVPVQVRVPVQQTYVIWQMRATTIQERVPIRIRAGFGWITLWRTVSRTAYRPVPVPHTRIAWVTTTQWRTVHDPAAAAQAALYRRCAESGRANLTAFTEQVVPRRAVWEQHWATLNRAAHEAWRAFNTTCRTIRQVGPTDVQECTYAAWRNYAPGAFERTIIVPPPRPPEDLIRRARDEVAPPRPGIHLNPRVEWEQIVHLPTWMWIDPGAWQPRSARAEAGRAWAEATATPVRVEWDMGNGDRVVCQGPGTPYDERRHESLQRTACSYTYRQSSAGRPGDAYTVTATLVYDVDWEGSGGAGGDLGTISRTSTAQVRVAELQALVDRVG